MIRKIFEKVWQALIKKRPNYLIEAGWFEDSKYSNGMPIGGIAAVQNYGATINNPGGQPFFKDKEGNVVYASKSSPYAKRMAKTKPHTIVIPPTHFMEHCQEKNKEKWKEQCIKAWGAVFRGEISAENAMEQLGMMMEGDIAKEIAQTNTPALSPKTIETRKNRMSDKKTTGNLTKRLIDTGVMFESVSHKVTKK